MGNKVGVFPSNFVSMLENLSPILANRRSNNITVTATNVSAATVASAKLMNSREDLVTNISHLLAEIDAPILPPKPGKYFSLSLELSNNEIFYHYRYYSITE